MYRTSTTFLMVEDGYRRERARRAFREQRQESWHRPPRDGSATGARGWRRVFHLRPAMTH